MLTLAVMAGMWAQAQTLDECRALAREHYPEISRLGLIEHTAQYSLSNAAKAWLPHGAVTGQLTYQDPVMALPEQFTQLMQMQGVNYPGLKPLQYKVGVDVSQQIWDGGRTSASRSKIKADAEVERQKTEVDLYDVDSRVQDVYFGLLLMDERIKAADLTATLLDSTLRQVDAMVMNGVATKADRQQIAARRLGLEQQLEQLRGQREAYAMVLSLLIGRPLGEISRPAAYKALIQRPTEQLFDSRLRAVEAAKRQVKSSVMPRVGAFINAYYGYPGLNYFKSMGSTKMTPNMIAGVSVQWDFGSLYTRKNSLNSLETQAETIENAREIFRFNRSMATAQQSQQIQTLRRVISNDEEILALQLEVLDAARAQLRNGVLDATSLLAKFTDAELARTDRETHLLELLQAIYKLQQTENQ